MTLTEYLLARYDAEWDDAAAVLSSPKYLRTAGMGWVDTGGGTEKSDELGSINPERTLAEVEAKRKRLWSHVADCECGEWPCRSLRLLAVPYAGRADFRAEWRVLDDAGDRVEA